MSNHASHWYICKVVDRILVEVGNAYAKKAASDKRDQEPELPL
jgi:hypothetical protein